ncbi:hypothetical protein FA95DRAFT_1558999 [Auriscalpium vulgare]|uniref:Uncharacterized protein n=1 Tax=Auriscalpium vulgare TaxID=40419 RepID=A0ACB8RVK0_9AGAM|nr:hypothetical protein FA95DRAFT_1558999 [Auriscalpium vulgare]
MVNIKAAMPFIRRTALHGCLDRPTSRSGRGPSPPPFVDTSESSSSLSAHPWVMERRHAGQNCTGSSAPCSTRRERGSMRGVHRATRRQTRHKERRRALRELHGRGWLATVARELAVDEGGEAEPAPPKQEVGSLTCSWGISMCLRISWSSPAARALRLRLCSSPSSPGNYTIGTVYGIHRGPVVDNTPTRGAQLGWPDLSNLGCFSGARFQDRRCLLSILQAVLVCIEGRIGG